MHQNAKLLGVTLAASLMLGALAGVAIAGALEDGIAAALRGDNAIAYQLLRPLADQGTVKAQYYLGSVYYGSQRYTDAARWYRNAADQGDPAAQNNLGIMYKDGQGVPQDYAEALRLFSKGCRTALRRSAVQSWQRLQGRTGRTTELC
jgi:TPR repeat protein